MQATIQTPVIDFTNGKTVIESINAIWKKDCTFDRFCAIRDTTIKSKTEIITVLHGMTIKDLEGYIPRRTGIKKVKLVQEVWDEILGSFDITAQGIEFEICNGASNWEAKLIEKANSVTADDFDKWQTDRAARAAAFKKAMTNPETLEEFRVFIRRHREGEKALSTEQRARYDVLMTGEIGARKAIEASRKDHITAVAVGETELIVVESYHAKKQIPLWVVRLAERVDRPIFEELKQRAHELDGYYSSYRGQGAIPGFTFEKKEAAELFTQIKDGDVNASALRAAINAERTIQRAERVQEKAITIEERATEELQKDRKANTVRRARMASSAEQQAIEDIEFAKVLFEIGQRTIDGTIQYLGRLATIIQLQDLYIFLNLCKWSYIRANNLRSEKYELTLEAIDHAKFPYPRLDKGEHMTALLAKLSQDKGKTLAARRMVKRLQAEKGEFLTIKEGLSAEDFNKLFCWSSPSLGSGDSQRYREQWATYTRIKRLGFTTIYELRTALRELFEIDKAMDLSPEFRKIQAIRELDRKFLTLNIPGFFPTPKELADKVVAAAQIEPGQRVCEPSAGLGHMAEAIAEAHPDNELICIENYTPLADALVLKGFEVVNADFLAITDQQYDRIIMNPPFEHLADIDHVYHAWKLLSAGGRLVAILAGNKDGSRKKVQDFKQFVEEYGSMRENEPGAFKSAFRPTGVNTVLVVLDKPHENKPKPCKGIQGVFSFN